MSGAFFFFFLKSSQSCLSLVSTTCFTINPLIIFLGPSDSVGTGLVKVTMTDMQHLQVSILSLRISLGPAESFDTVDCSLLLEILSSFGSKDVTAAWFSSDLMGAPFCVLGRELCTVWILTLRSF